MRKSIALVALLHFALTSFGQIFTPVKWDFSSKQVSDTDFELVFRAKIDKGWYVYSQYLEGDDGPIKTSFNFDAGGHFSKVGKNVETSAHRKELNDPLFDNMRVIKFAQEVTFTQRVKVSDFSKPIAGYLEFMTCDDARCLPPAEVEFSFALKPAAKNAEPAKPEKKPTEKTPATPSNGTPTTAPADPKKATTEPATTLIVDVPTNAGTEPLPSDIKTPVTWSLDIQKISETEYDLGFKATVDEGWYIYSQNIGDGGPIPTSFLLGENMPGELVGKAKEESSHKVAGFDKIFSMNVTKYKQEVKFIQRLKVQDPAQPISGTLEFMACDNNKCLPPAEVPFRVVPASLNARVGEAAVGDLTADTTTQVPGQVNIDKSFAANCGEVIVEDKSLWGTFLLGILGGLLALLTPCVWPMIPLTVSFFTKSAGKKSKGLFNAFMYGFYILLVYLLLSVPFHLLDSINPDILNEISTNTWLNLLFFAVFIVFAFSFFGYFELTLPSSWLNKSSQAEGIGGALGIFFMALTLALVSFSCTGPILGSLLAGTLSSNTGNDPAMLLSAGMAGFGFALALPFGLFAAFPSWLNSLPKSGGWMTTVKVVLGFLELALALKFFSNADLVNKWGLLKIELFLGLWIVIFLLTGLYLLGKIRFPHDSPLKKVPLPRMLLAILSFAFVVYLASGLRYDEKISSYPPLKLLSGLAPPVCYSWLHACKCPANLSCFKDFDEGMAYAQKVNKPVMIDFTGHACVNCRKMEENVWPEQPVHSLINENFVLISLYVDEKIALPQEEVVQLKNGQARKLRYTGHRWQVLQTENFNNNSQPYYVLLSPDGKMLNQPVGYTPDVSEYAAFLQCGLDRWKELE